MDISNTIVAPPATTDVSELEQDEAETEEVAQDGGGERGGERGGEEGKEEKGEHWGGDEVRCWTLGRVSLGETPDPEDLEFLRKLDWIHCTIVPVVDRLAGPIGTK